MVPSSAFENSSRVVVTGAIGYIGSRLVSALSTRGFDVRALVRKGSESKAPRGCTVIIGNPLDRSTYAGGIAHSGTFVHHVGVSHPSPSKAREFREIDYTAAREAINAARGAHVGHFVYVSVAHPSPVMKEFVRVRTECENLVTSSGLNATILRPWYVLGPGHRWPYLLMPLYWIAGHLPFTRDSAIRLGLVTIDDLIQKLVWTVQNPPSGIRILEVRDIRKVNSFSSK